MSPKRNPLFLIFSKDNINALTLAVCVRIHMICLLCFAFFSLSPLSVNLTLCYNSPCVDEYCHQRCLDISLLIGYYFNEIQRNPIRVNDAYP